MRWLRGASAGFAGALLMASASAWSPAAVAASPRAFTPSELYLVASLSYASKEAEAALRRQAGAVADQQRRRIDELDRKLKTVAVDAVRRRGEVAALQAELAKAKTEFTAELAAKDADFARTRESLGDAATELMQTPEGVKAVEVYLAGGPGSADAALTILSRKAEAEATVDAKLAARRNAARLRSIAAFGLDAYLKGDLNRVRAIAYCEAVVAADPGTHQDWLQLGRLYSAERRRDQAEQAGLRALERATTDVERVNALIDIGNALENRGDRAGALARYEQGLLLTRKLAAIGGGPVVWRSRRNLYAALANIGNSLTKGGDLPQAISALSESLAIMRKLSAEDPTFALFYGDIATNLQWLAVARSRSGDTAGARANHGEAVTISRRIAAIDANDSAAWRGFFAAFRAKFRLASSLKARANFEAANGDMAAALRDRVELLGVMRELTAHSGATIQLRFDLANTLAGIGDIHLKQGDTAAALSSYQEQLTFARAMMKSDPKEFWSQDALGQGLAKVAAALLKRGDAEAAVTSYRESLVVQRALPAEAKPEGPLAEALEGMAEALSVRNNKVSAVAHLEEALFIRRALAARPDAVVDDQRALLIVLAKLAERSAPNHDWRAVVEQAGKMRAKGQLVASDDVLVQRATALAGKAGQ